MVERRSRSHWLMYGLAALVLGTALSAEASRGDCVPRVPLTLADATCRDLLGVQHRLRSTDRRPTVYVFLSTECPIANSCTPGILALAQAYPRVRFFGVYANAHESVRDIARHARERGFDFPIVKDDGALALHLGARVTPEAILVDGRGIIRYRGRIDDPRDPARVRSHDLSAALAAVLTGRSVACPTTPAFGCALRLRSAERGWREEDGCIPRSAQRSLSPQDR